VVILLGFLFLVSGIVLAGGVQLFLGLPVYCPPFSERAAFIVLLILGYGHALIGLGLLHARRWAWRTMLFWFAVVGVWNLGLGIVFIISPPADSKPGALFHFGVAATVMAIRYGIRLVASPVFACPIGRTCDAMRADEPAPCDLVFDSCSYMGGSRDVPFFHSIRMTVCPDALVVCGRALSGWTRELEIPLEAIVGVRRLEWSEGAAWDRDTRAPGFERLVRLVETIGDPKGRWNWVEIEWEEGPRIRAELLMFTVRRPFPWFVKSWWRHPEPMTAEFCRTLRSAISAESRPGTDSGPAD